MASARSIGFALGPIVEAIAWGNVRVAACLGIGVRTIHVGQTPPAKGNPRMAHVRSVLRIEEEDEAHAALDAL